MFIEKYFSVCSLIYPLVYFIVIDLELFAIECSFHCAGSTSYTALSRTVIGLYQFFYYLLFSVRSSPASEKVIHQSMASQLARENRGIIIDV